MNSPQRALENTRLRSNRGANLIFWSVGRASLSSSKNLVVLVDAVPSFFFTLLLSERAGAFDRAILLFPSKDKSFGKRKFFPTNIFRVSIFNLSFLLFRGRKTTSSSSLVKKKKETCTRRYDTRSAERLRRRRLPRRLLERGRRSPRRRRRRFIILLLLLAPHLFIVAFHRCARCLLHLRRRRRRQKCTT